MSWNHARSAHATGTTATEIGGLTMSEWKKPWVYNPREAEERILQLEERNRQLLEENTDLKILLFSAYLIIKAEVNSVRDTNDNKPKM
jgi:hypothetical protein